jgi:hypothetical protein
MSSSEPGACPEQARLDLLDENLGHVDRSHLVEYRLAAGRMVVGGNGHGQPGRPHGAMRGAPISAWVTLHSSLSISL